MQEEKSREQLILKTLSFFEPMNYAQIIFELNHDELRDHPDFTDEDLKEVLKILVKKKQIILIEKDGEKYWQRKMPRRSRWKILDFLSSLFK